MRPPPPLLEAVCGGEEVLVGGSELSCAIRGRAAEGGPPNERASKASRKKKRPGRWRREREKKVV